MSRRGTIAGLVFGPKAAEWASLRSATGGFVLAGRGTVEGSLPLHDTQEADPAEADATVARVRKEAGGLKGAVTVGLQSDAVMLRVLDLPAAPPDELAGMVQLQMDKLSPFPSEALVASFEVVRRQGESCLVLAAGAKAETIERIGAYLARGGIVPARMDACALGWWRVLADAGRVRGDGRQLVVTLGSDLPEIAVFQDGVPVLFRSLGSVTGMTDDDLTDELAREIEYTLMSVELERGPAEGCLISLWHGDRVPEGLVRRLRENGLYAVEVRPQSELASVAEGIARRSFGGPEPALDLRPEPWVQAARSRRFRSRLWTVGGALAALWVLLVGSGIGWLYHEESRLSALKAEFEAVHGPAMEVRDMRRRVALLRRYEDRSDSALECLREISRLQPAGLELMSFTYLKGEGVKISGSASSAGAIYEFKRQLDVSPVFKGSSLAGTRVDRSRQRELFDLDLALPKVEP